MRWLLVCVALAGCARAGKENIIIGGIIDAGPRRDAAAIPPDAVPDADAMIDAPAVQAAPEGALETSELGEGADGVTPATGSN